MKNPLEKFDSKELARLSSLDAGVEVTPSDVRNYFAEGDKALRRFDPDTRHEIRATLLKEIAGGM